MGLGNTGGTMVSVRCIVLAAAVSCGGTSSTPARDDAGGDAPTDAAYLPCMNAMGAIDASLKACQSDADCVIKSEEINCCGSTEYVGINKSSASQFDVCEAAWAAHFPGCGCPEGPSTTEDGMTVGFQADAAAPQVHCVIHPMNGTGGGQCLTYLP